ncbi:MAG TPA: serine/threonine-protein kinase [Planctomycetota bacterium]|nr:serine/threonine-protein kinase [Planctomycetota bacterium]
MTSPIDPSSTGNTSTGKVLPTAGPIPSSRAASLLPGHVLDGRFQVKELLNKGGMASVFEALDLSTGQPVALKVPLPKYQMEPLYAGRFLLEEQTGSLLSHPSLLRIIPVKEKSRPYIVMERLRGKLLADLLTGGRRLPEARALELAILVAKAVEYMHERNVLHRDLKPGNIMICDDGSIRVIDFGLATVEGQAQGARFGIPSALGTPDYMPPEHVRGQPGDQRSDVYCVGVILYEMLLGTVPYQEHDIFAVMHARVVGDPQRPRNLDPNLSPQLEEILLHALERDPERRYQRMSEFRKDLEAPEKVPLTGRADRLTPPSAWKIRWRRVRHFVLTLLFLLALLLLVALAVLKSANPRPRGRSPDRTMRNPKPGSENRLLPGWKDGNPQDTEMFG